MNHIKPKPKNKNSSISIQKALKQLEKLEELSKEMPLAAEDWMSEWQILIAIILSARTRDEITIPVAEKLFKKYRYTEQLARAKISEVQKIIRPVNFYKNKSKHIIDCAKQLTKKYSGNVPHDEKLLLELSGVGRKTMNVFLAEIGKEAIGVDTHVAYISQKLNWTKDSNPEKIEQDLKKLFPKEHWRKINSCLVRFGKTYTSRKQKNKILENINEIG